MPSLSTSFLGKIYAGRLFIDLVEVEPLQKVGEPLVFGREEFLSAFVLDLLIGKGFVEGGADGLDGLIQSSNLLFA